MPKFIVVILIALLICLFPVNCCGKDFVGDTSIEIEMTAYTAVDDPENNGEGITATGYQLTDDDDFKVVAVDPDYYPYGTKFYIEGVGLVVARDCGGDIKGPSRMDLFVSLRVRDIAWNWGRRKIRVWRID
jgi:3D (Asp-Asp-Asp) domain-containing protein